MALAKVALYNCLHGKSYHSDYKPSQWRLDSIHYIGAAAAQDKTNPTDMVLG